MNQLKQTAKQAKQQGFTLVEIIVVVTILSVLAALVVPQLIGRAEDARIKAAQADLKALSTALDLYKLDNARYPSTDQGLDALVSKPSSDPVPRNYKADGYLENEPLDPWGSPYLYQYPGERGKRYDIYTLGADGVEGGEGEDADIGNWMK